MKNFLLFLILLPLLWTCEFSNKVDTSTNMVGPEVQTAIGEAPPPPSYDYDVYSKSDFAWAVDRAGSGETIHLPGSTTITFGATDYNIYEIDAGVTLIGDVNANGDPRGTLYVNAEPSSGTANRGFLIVNGNGVTIKNIKIQGPNQTTTPDPNNHAGAGILTSITSSTSSLTVDNCEIFGWSHAGVNIWNSTDAWIKNSYFYNNQRDGLGYGVILGSSSEALIEYNKFNYNRHAIAGTGVANQSYTARHNVVETGHPAVPAGSRGHSFDMHGGADREDGTDTAGKTITIHDNIFKATKDTNNRVVEAVAIRGIPTDIVEIYNNTFYHTNPEDAVNQDNALGNFYAHDNTYAANNLGWYISVNGNEHWYRIFTDSDVLDAAHTLVGKFNTHYKYDDFDQLVKADGSGWDYAGLPWSIAPGIIARWYDLTGSGYTIDRMRPADFDENGETDIIIKNGTSWKILYNSSGSWYTKYNMGTDPIDQYRFGDFDKDGKDDVMRATGSKWQYSDNGTGVWTDLWSRTETIDKILVGDIYNNDSRAVILFINSLDRWYVWDKAGRIHRADNYVNMGIPSFDDCAFGDFDGDRDLDVFKADGTNWEVSYFNGYSYGPWQFLNNSGYKLDRIVLGDFKGNDTTDVILLGANSTTSVNY